MKKILICFASFLVLLLLLGAVYLTSKYRASMAPVNALIEAGEPIQLSELTEQIQASGENATNYLNVIENNAEAFRAETDTFLINDNFAWDGGKYPPEDLEALNKVVQANQEIMDGINRASEADHFTWPTDYSVGAANFFDQLSDFTTKSKGVAMVANARTRYFAAIGEADAAVEASFEHLKLFSLQRQPPTMLGLQTNLACRTMALESLNNLLVSNAFSDEVRDRIEKELANHSMSDAVDFGFRSERANGLELLDTQFMMMRIMGTEGGLTKSYCDVLQHAIDCGVSDPYAAKPLGKIEDNVGMITGLLMPQIERTRNRVHRTRATIRCLRVLNQIQAKLTAGTAPDEIDIESLGLPADEIKDPFDGKPLRVKRSDKGWLIYSVGPNKIDDGGSEGDEEDEGDVVVGVLVTYE